MGVEKLLHGLARLVTRSILNYDDVVPSLRQHVEQKGRIAFRVKASCMSFVEKLAGEIVDQAKDLVAFAFAAGAHFGLFTCGCPRVAQRAPLGKAGFIAKEQESLTLLSCAQNPRPLCLTPFQTLGLIE